MDPMRSRARVEKQVVYPVGREEVWAAITRPEELSGWFGMEVVSLDLRPAGRIVFKDSGGTSRRALVEEVEPPYRFVFRWLPAPVGGPGHDPGSRVDFSLEEVPGGTALTVVEPPSLAMGEAVSWMNSLGAQWDDRLSRLGEHLGGDQPEEAP